MSRLNTESGQRMQDSTEGGSREQGYVCKKAGMHFLANFKLMEWKPAFLSCGWGAYKTTIKRLSKWSEEF